MTAPLPAPMATPSNVPAWANKGAAASINAIIPALSAMRITISFVLSAGEATRRRQKRSLGPSQATEINGQFYTDRPSA